MGIENCLPNMFEILFHKNCLTSCLIACIRGCALLSCTVSPFSDLSCSCYVKSVLLFLLFSLAMFSFCQVFRNV